MTASLKDCETQEIRRKTALNVHCRDDGLKEKHFIEFPFCLARFPGIVGLSENARFSFLCSDGRVKSG